MSDQELKQLEEQEEQEQAVEGSVEVEQKTPKSSGDIIFQLKDEAGNPFDILTLKANGDILVRGNLADNDKEVVDAFKEFVYSLKK